MIKKFINALEQWRYNCKEYVYIKNLIKSVKYTEILNSTVVINTVRTFRRSIDPESFLGMLLALNGAKVKILIDDGVLYHWDTLQVDQISNLKKIKKSSLNPNHFFNLHERILSKYFLYVLLRRNIRRKAFKIFTNKIWNISFIVIFLKQKKFNMKILRNLRNLPYLQQLDFLKIVI